MGASVILTAWLGLTGAGMLATLWWSLKQWTRRDTLTLWTKLLSGAVAAPAILGGLGTVVGLVKARRAIAVESVDPSEKARALAEGISEAMNCTAAGLLVWLPSVIALTIVTRRRRRSGG